MCIICSLRYSKLTFNCILKQYETEHGTILSYYYQQRYKLIAYKCEDVNVGSKRKKDNNPKIYTIDNNPRLVGGRFKSSTKSGNPIKLQNACTTTHDAKCLVWTNK